MEKIEKKAVKQIFDNYFDCYADEANDSLPDRPAMTFDAVWRLINALPTTNDEWVSVEDRLPEIDCRTYVYDQDGDIEIMEYISEDEYWNTAWRITHWMPFKLPQPPTK